MPGLTFLNLAFLAGAAAAAVPVLIHLFSRRHARRIDWSSVRFIREVNRQRIRRIKLRQLLLLILRVLAIILFAVAMGRPALTGSFLASGRAPSTVCLVVATRYSRVAAPGGDVTFDSARQRARDVVDSVHRAESGCFIAGSHRVESATR